MRVNLPVTNTEYPINDDTLIVSTTDTKGRMTHVNPTFIEVSGFSEEELIGKRIELCVIRICPKHLGFMEHVETGLTRTGLVKNRRKNGDFYWINANATPLLENGKITGYLSVRTKAPRTAIDQAAPDYRKILDGKAPNLKIEKVRWCVPIWLGNFLRFLK